jgi:uncharacterized membrane protein
MEWFITRSALFYLGGFLGWVMEVFFRRFVSQKKWVNPGFLTGPLLPLYGFGLTAFYVFCNEIPWASISDQVWVYRLVEVLCVGAFMTLIEYIAGLIFIKGAGVKLWDYHDRWGNIQGIICPLFSFIWLLIGAVYIFGLNDYVFVPFCAWIWANYIPINFVLGALYGILVVDFGWSIGLVAKVRKAVADHKLVVGWEEMKVSFQETAKKARQHMSWIFPFHARKKDSFNEMMAEYTTNLRRELQAEAEKKAAAKARREARHAAHRKAQEEPKK